MLTRRQLVKTTAPATAAYALPLCAEEVVQKKTVDQETTFILASDTHYSSVVENHRASHTTQKHFNLMHVDYIAADGTFRFLPKNHFSTLLT